MEILGKMEILGNNGNFGQKLEILVKNWKFWSKIGNFGLK